MNLPSNVACRTLLGRVRLLSHRSHRDRTGMYLVQGIRQVVTALDHHAVETLIHSEVLLQNPYAQKRVRLARRDGVPTLRVSPEDYRALSTTERASGLAAVVRMHWTPLEDAGVDDGTCWLALGAIRSGGNVGTLLRTAEAAGVRGVMFLAEDTDPFAPDVVRASMGGCMGLRLVRCTPPALSAWAQRHGADVVGASPGADTDVWSAGLPARCVVVLGGERQGLTDDERRLCTRLVRIPMVGRADSLNVGVAGGIMLFEWRRQQAATAAMCTRDQCTPC